MLIKKYKLLLIPLFCLITGCITYYYYYYYYENKNDQPAQIIETNEDIDLVETESEVIIKYCTVDIKGAVNQPGVYQVAEDSRVIDVIKKAGGLTKNADTYYLNLSKKVHDEMVIIVYTKTDITNYKKMLKQNADLVKELKTNTKNDAIVEVEPNLSNNNQTTLLNINTATLEQLMTLPGIGESKAKEIINYREINNGFKSIDEIKAVNGIGDSTFAKIKDYITI
ncbi:MAG: helix-hairpin-helix domain-containing protein [Bacilli bacterium]|jgi:competence protein ComEA